MTALQGRNEAAERLRRDIEADDEGPWRAELLADLRDALAAERRATVERLREMFDAQMTNPDARWCSADEIAAILDEEAARVG